MRLDTTIASLAEAYTEFHNIQLPAAVLFVVIFMEY